MEVEEDGQGEQTCKEPGQSCFWNIPIYGTNVGKNLFDELRSICFYQERRLCKASRTPSLDDEEKLQCTDDIVTGQVPFSFPQDLPHTLSPSSSSQARGMSLILPGPTASPWFCSPLSLEAEIFIFSVTFN